MSFAALAWAAKQRPGNLAAKMILLGLANYADEQGCSYPSTAALAEFGDMDHKTATAALDRLDELGLIADTGERQGRTRQIKVYRLALERPPETEASQKRKPPVSFGKDPQKRGTDTIKDTISQKTSSSSKVRARKQPAESLFKLPEELPDWIPADAWAGWIEMRKRKRAPLDTQRAFDLAISELRKLAEAGHPPGAVLDQSTRKRWIDVYPLKDNHHERTSSPSSYAASRGANRGSVADAVFAAHDRVSFEG